MAGLQIKELYLSILFSEEEDARPLTCNSLVEQDKAK
jgi:hypothetical protein